MSLERFASRRGNSARSLALALVSMIGVSSLVAGCGGGDADASKAAAKPAANGADASATSKAGAPAAKKKGKVDTSSRREHQGALDGAAGK